MAVVGYFERMTAVEIEYCVPCGNLSDAMEVYEEILSELGQDVDWVALKTGVGGDFKVRIDGELFYYNHEHDHEFHVEDVIDEVRDRAEASQRRIAIARHLL